MSVSVLSWFMLVVQLAFIAYTAVYAPARPRLGWVSYIAYTIAVFTLWMIYTMGAMVLDSKAGNDVPGAGYLAVGFVAWVVGSVLFAIRAMRRRD